MPVICEDFVTGDSFHILIQHDPQIDRTGVTFTFNLYKRYGNSPVITKSHVVGSGPNDNASIGLAYIEIPHEDTKLLEPGMYEGEIIRTISGVDTVVMRSGLNANLIQIFPNLNLASPVSDASNPVSGPINTGYWTSIGLVGGAPNCGTNGIFTGFDNFDDGIITAPAFSPETQVIITKNNGLLRINRNTSASTQNTTITFPWNSLDVGQCTISGQIDYSFNTYISPVSIGLSLGITLYSGVLTNAGGGTIPFEVTRNLTDTCSLIQSLVFITGNLAPGTDIVVDITGLSINSTAITI